MKKKLLIPLVVILALVACAAVFFRTDPKQPIVREAYTEGDPLATMANSFTE